MAAEFDSENDLKFHLRQADSHKCPRRRDFNALYLKYCHDKLGRRNGAEMFETLEERIDKFKKSNEGAKIT